MKPNRFDIVSGNAVVFHHAYIGLLLLGWPHPINLLGLYILVDDLWEHLIDYRTPLRLLFEKILVPILWRKS